MRIVTVNLPRPMLAKIKQLTGDDGLYPSVSELIRIAVRKYLIKELREAESFLTPELKRENIDIKKVKETVNKPDIKEDEIFIDGKVYTLKNKKEL